MRRFAKGDSKLRLTGFSNIEVHRRGSSGVIPLVGRDSPYFALRFLYQNERRRCEMIKLYTAARYGEPPAH